MSKYLWQKKKEYFSEVESYGSRFLYNHEGEIIMISFFAKNYDEHTDCYEHNDNEFTKYLFTEEEVKEHLPNTHHMFEPIVVKTTTNPIYGEIKGTEGE